ncbi:MAG: phosphotransferase [Tepidisphaeraceae bacterium]|jgi:hypothetical protein
MTSHAPIAADYLSAVLRRVSAADGEFQNAKAKAPEQLHRGELADALACTSSQRHSARDLFDRLRWGGTLLYVAQDRHDAVKFSIHLTERGFEIVEKIRALRRGPLGLPIPFFSRTAWYFTARKVQLVQPGHLSDRFTYHVYLSRPTVPKPYHVVKEVPTLDQVKARLHSKWPELSDELIDRRARKFAERIFPIFLTREAAILKIVNRDLPAPYQQRIPRLIDMETDERGFARKLHLQWLRNGGEAITQLQFARQSADLLRVLHDQVGVMHLDLRLDNFVITPDGVGFVDFGSAVRVGEDLSASPLLSGLFEELMRTSEIQRMLLKMTRSGQVTSETICGGLHKVDKAVDFFYLAVQINSPHSNPDLKELIRYDKQSEEARLLAELTAKILRPQDPAHPAFNSAADILGGIEKIEQSLQTTPERTPA